MSKITGVFQMGFDITYDDETTGADQSALFEAIETVINNYKPINGSSLGYESIGCDNSEDMTEVYKHELGLEIK